MSNTEWKTAAITTQSHGPRYVIDSDDGTEGVDTIRFNGFKIGFNGRVELEYTDLEIGEEGYPTNTVADFTQPDGGE